MWRNVCYSILGIVAGIVVLTVVSFAIEAAADPLMAHLFPGVLPGRHASESGVAAQLVMFVYTFFSVVAGGYVTAWIARHAPVRDAVIMGVIEALLTFWLLSTRFHQPPLISLIKGVIVCIPSAWIGGVLRARTAKPKTIAQTA